MGKALFYHLTERPLEATVAMLLSRSLGQGWRVAVRGTDLARLGWLDGVLWTADPASFLPHGVAGGSNDADQPILLTTGTDAPNAPSCILSIDGAEVTAQDVSGHERVWVLFDGHDATALDRARAQWKALVADGCLAEYWAEDGGRWQMKAQSGAKGG